MKVEFDFLLSSIAFVVCPVWALIFTSIIWYIEEKTEYKEYEGTSTNYYVYNFLKSLWGFRDWCFYVLKIIVLVLPAIVYSAVYIFYCSKYLPASDTLLYIFLWVMTLGFSAALYFNLHKMVLAHMTKKKVFDALVNEARKHYPDFDTNPETKKQALKKVADSDLFCSTCEFIENDNYRIFELDFSKCLDEAFKED